MVIALSHLDKNISRAEIKLIENKMLQKKIRFARSG
jgi:hypothetical protein